MRQGDDSVMEVLGRTVRKSIVSFVHMQELVCRTSKINCPELPFRLMQVTVLTAASCSFCWFSLTT